MRRKPGTTYSETAGPIDYPVPKSNGCGTERNTNASKVAKKARMLALIDFIESSGTEKECDELRSLIDPDGRNG